MATKRSTKKSSPASDEKVPSAKKKTRVAQKSVASKAPDAARSSEKKPLTKPARKAPAKTGVTKKIAKKAEPKLLSGGNPQIAKADGDAPVQAYLAALPGWKKEAGKRIDALVARTVPNVRKAVQWNSPFYGSPDKGFFLSFHAFSKYLKITFFNGTSLRPMPPGESKSAGVRYLDLYEKDVLDTAQFEKWVKRAATLPGWTP